MANWINRDSNACIKTIKEELGLYAFFILYLSIWVMGGEWLPLASELDSTEQIVWSQSWQWGYYKHPPLPSLLLNLLNRVFDGPSKGLNAFVAQGCNVIAMIYVWLLAKQILSRKLALVAVLLTSLIAYHNFRAFAFNHNTVSLPFTAAALYYFYGAVRRPKQLSNWCWLGLVSGLAMLTKYSALLVFASFFIWLVWQRLLTQRAILTGLLCSVLIAVLIFSPHVFWLIDNNWPSFRYLQDKLTESGHVFSILFGFTMTQFIRLSFAVPTLLGIWLLIKSGRIVKTSVASVQSSAGAIYDRNFLLVMFFTPLGLAYLQLFLLGGELNSNWISAFFLPLGSLITLVFLKGFEPSQLLKYVVRLTVVTQICIVVGFFALAVVYPKQVGSAARLTFPSRALADKVSEIWRSHQSQPIPVIISDYWTAGNVLLHLRPEPPVLIDNSLEKSTGLTAQDIAACTAFVLINQEGISQDYVALMNQAQVKGEFSVSWGFLPKGKEIHYVWAIKVPEQGAGACRLAQPQKEVK